MATQPPGPIVQVGAVSVPITITSAQPTTGRHRESTSDWIHRDWQPEDRICAGRGFANHTRLGVLARQSISNRANCARAQVCLACDALFRRSTLPSSSEAIGANHCQRLLGPEAADRRDDELNALARRVARAEPLRLLCACYTPSSATQRLLPGWFGRGLRSSRQSGRSQIEYSTHFL